MNAVGIDVSKSKSMVAVLRPCGEVVSAPFEVKHTVSDIRSNHFILCIGTGLVKIFSVE